MKRARKELQPGEKIFVGIDMHKLKWHVTVRTADFELFSGSIPGQMGSIEADIGPLQGTPDTYSI